MDPFGSSSIHAKYFRIEANSVRFQSKNADASAIGRRDYFCVRAVGLGFSGVIHQTSEEEF